MKPTIIMVKAVASCDFDLVVKGLWCTIAFDLLVKDVACLGFDHKVKALWFTVAF